MNKLDLYINKDGDKLRCGYTTGSTATAASKGAAKALLTGEVVEKIKLSTPADIDLNLYLESCKVTKDYGVASVKKEAGDDIDATDQIEIFAKVSYNDTGEINIDGGVGIGRITQKGIYGDIGDPAINPVPREMIKTELRNLDPEQGFDVLIYSPEGVEVGKKTFNKNIGIEGGISIIGTKGIVYPMSEEAYLKTIYMEIDAIKNSRGTDVIVLTPGNYGEDWIKKNKGDLPVVQVSNFIGKGLKYAYKVGFRKFILIGHIGKFAKLAMGAYNTHNETVDLRMESFVYYMALEGVDRTHLKAVSNILTAEKGIDYLVENNLGYIVADMEEGIVNRVKKYLKDEDIEVNAIIYSFSRGVDFD